LEAYNELINVKTELEQLRSSHALFLHAMQLLEPITPDGADDLLTLLAKAIALAIVPLDHVVFGDLRVMFRNMQETSRHAFRYSTASRTQGSASRFVDQFITGADGADHPNQSHVPTAKYIKRWMIQQHPDAMWKSGISDLMILNFLARGSQNFLGLEFTAEFPMPSFIQIDATDIRKNLSFGPEGDFQGAPIHSAAF
jgi:hypothetical protein